MFVKTTLSQFKVIDRDSSGWLIRRLLSGRQEVNEWSNRNSKALKARRSVVFAASTYSIFSTFPAMPSAIALNAETALLKAHEDRNYVDFIRGHIVRDYPALAN